MPQNFKTEILSAHKTTFLYSKMANGKNSLPSQKSNSSQPLEERRVHFESDDANG